jgi:hypothetical protein
MPVIGLPDGDEEDIAEILGATLTAIDASPYPAGEWEPAREFLDDELLSRVLSISSSSVRRYAAGLRETPDEVAWRLHVVARVLASLIGSYNEYGIRRWFDRPRTTLGGQTPAEVMRAAENEDDAALNRVLELAGALEGAASAT